MAKDIINPLRTEADKINRGRELSRKDDNAQNFTIGLQDIDHTLFYYFENIIRPQIEENGELVKVPVMYANPERWAAIQKQGFLRDKKRKIMTPLVAFRRTGISKDDTMVVDKIDPMQPKLHQQFQSRYTKENRYDKFSALTGITPKKEMFNVAIPDYVVLDYEFTIWTSFTDQMNNIIEKIQWSEGSYWGEPGKFRFRATIESFEDASEYDGNQRKIKTNFSVSLRGYLLPDSFNNALTTQKFITPKQIVINDNVDVNLLKLVDTSDANTVRVVTNIGSGGEGGGGEGDSPWELGSLGGQQAYILDYGMETTGAAKIGGSLESGAITATGDINTTGQVLENGNSVTDHGTAMSIVFGG